MRAFGLLFIVMAIIIVISVAFRSSDRSGGGGTGGERTAYVDFLKVNTKHTSRHIYSMWRVIA